MSEREEDGTAEVPVVLTYRYTTEDFRETERALWRVIVRQRPLLYLGTIFMLVLLFVDLTPATVLISVGAVLQVVSIIGGTHAHVQWLNRESEKHGEFRAKFDAAGMGITTALRNDAFGWSDHSHYTETTNLFLLVRLGTMKPADFAPIPKRGLPDPADVDRLRALLGRHLTRV
ncbi:YcxB family protein [Amycolatopsis nigrescens]|uniref:YcxB family protein n=1 Tax=Amycolatopsis nigrescens TaxID=381445 RepID=UPI0003781198|nr:YcxB family protein [Amycolatopsis nigrescens]